MAEEESFDQGPGWDEFQWERFMKEQDAAAERYMELFEQYIDEPDRDALIAREMGWSEEDTDPIVVQWSGDNEPDDEHDHFPKCGDPGTESGGWESTGEDDLEDTEDVESHPLYLKANDAVHLLTEMLATCSADGMEQFAEQLLDHSTTALSKLAVALASLDDPETGMTLAYLKRSLHALHDAMGVSAGLGSREPFRSAGYRRLLTLLFEVREGVVDCMGSVRRSAREQTQGPDGDF